MFYEVHKRQYIDKMLNRKREKKLWYIYVFEYYH